MKTDTRILDIIYRTLRVGPRIPDLEAKPLVIQVSSKFSGSRDNVDQGQVICSFPSDPELRNNNTVTGENKEMDDFPSGGQSLSRTQSISVQEENTGN